MSDPESKMLRDEIVRLRTEIVGLKAEIVGLRTKNMKLKRVNGYHENPHTPITKQPLGAEKKDRGKKK